jgi:hypothetical protein
VTKDGVTATVGANVTDVNYVIDGGLVKTM